LQTLLSENQVVVIEGAGSPAEINLHAHDFVNMRTAKEAHAACLLVTDIDRGGAFAHLYGTHQLLTATERAAVYGFIVNRFRGSPESLSPGLEVLERLTGVPTLAVLPLCRGHGLPEEDGVFDDARVGVEERLRIAVVAYPCSSNLDEFQPLRNVDGIELIWARRPSELRGVDWIVLPGSKNTLGDLGWLRQQKLDTVILDHASAQRTVLGLCGGLQILGHALIEPGGVESRALGLGLLPLITTFESTKLLRATDARFADTTGGWQVLAQVGWRGYEIHNGRTLPQPLHESSARVAMYSDTGEVIGWQCGPVLGLYAHGMFESPAVMRALFGLSVRTLDGVFNGLADVIERNFKAGSLARLIA
jgi:adenosylcobyric acid synthase